MEFINFWTHTIKIIIQIPAYIALEMVIHTNNLWTLCTFFCVMTNEYINQNTRRRMVYDIIIIIIISYSPSHLAIISSSLIIYSM